GRVPRSGGADQEEAGGAGHRAREGRDGTEAGGGRGARGGTGGQPQRGGLPYRRRKEPGQPGGSARPAETAAGDLSAQTTGRPGGAARPGNSARPRPQRHGARGKQRRKDGGPRPTGGYGGAQHHLEERAD